MNKEDKELLLKDLCCRLPYGVEVKIGSTHTPLSLDILMRVKFGYFPRPYLRPMSSITEKEKRELLSFGAVTRLENGEVIDVSCVGFDNHAAVQDYLNSHHFDYRGLIEKGLALEAPEGMYK